MQIVHWTYYRIGLNKIWEKILTMHVMIYNFNLDLYQEWSRKIQHYVIWQESNLQPAIPLQPSKVLKKLFQLHLITTTYIL